jgi:hypothetical protein
MWCRAHLLWIVPLVAVGRGTVRNRNQATNATAARLHPRSRIHEQLAGDLALHGAGRDELAKVAANCGHLSTYKRLEQLMTMQKGTPQA